MYLLGRFYNWVLASTKKLFSIWNDHYKSGSLASEVGSNFINHISEKKNVRKSNLFSASKAGRVEPMPNHSWPVIGYSTYFME